MIAGPTATLPCEHIIADEVEQEEPGRLPEGNRQPIIKTEFDAKDVQPLAETALPSVIAYEISGPLDDDAQDPASILFPDGDNGLLLDRSVALEEIMDEAPVQVAPTEAPGPVHRRPVLQSNRFLAMAIPGLRSSVLSLPRRVATEDDQPIASASSQEHRPVRRNERDDITALETAPHSGKKKRKMNLLTRERNSDEKQALSRPKGRGTFGSGWAGGKGERR